MSEIVLYTVISLTGLGLIASTILYFVATRFKVYEDPRIDAVEQALPNTNCGGCGHPGCRAFAEACVKADDLSDLHCPVGGNDTMKNVAEILQMEVEARDKYVAVVRCSGSFEYRQKTSVYEGAPSCAVAASLYGGDTGCSYGCLGLADCVRSCDFEAMYMDEKTGLPVVIEDKCVACNACVTTCPKDIMALWPQGRKDRKIFVACINEDKGGTAKKSCEVACTGCSKCEKECKYDAITIENYLAYIDGEKCKLCRKCVDVCGSHAIHEMNFPPKKIREEVGESKVSARSARSSTQDSGMQTSDPPSGEVDVIAMAKAGRKEKNDAASEDDENQSKGSIE